MGRLYEKDLVRSEGFRELRRQVAEHDAAGDSDGYSSTIRMWGVDLLTGEVHVVKRRGVLDALPGLLQEEEMRLELPYSSESIRLEARDVPLDDLESVGLVGVGWYLSS